MAHRDLDRLWPPAPAADPPRLELHLGELYRIQPLPDEFMRLALAVGELCRRTTPDGPTPSPE